MTRTYMDPVCGMEIRPDMAAGHSDYKGTTYYFCSLACKEAFDKEPERYIVPAEEEPVEPLKL